jgi:hypothetical protein
LSTKNLSNFTDKFGKISVLFRLFQILEILDLAMAKDEKVNIALTYYIVGAVSSPTLLAQWMGCQ